jgi:hypothetical protein
MTTGGRSKLVFILVSLLILAVIPLALKHPSTRNLPAPSYYTNKVGTIYAGVQMGRDLQLPFVALTNMNLFWTTFLARPDGWVDESWVLSARWNSSTGYAAIAAVPWEKWKLQLRAVQYRQFRLGPFKLGLPPQTNVWISSELPPRGELRQRTNVTFLPFQD